MLTVSDLSKVEELIGFQFINPGATEGPNEVNVASIKHLVKRSGYEMHRIWLPGTVGTPDYRFDRVNIHINENDVITQVDVG